MSDGGEKDTQSLDRDLMRLQKSTRTTVPALLPLHDVLRQRMRWYYNWHLWPWSKFFHALFLIVFLLGIGGIFYQFLLGQPKPVLAAEATLYPASDGSPLQWNCTDTDGDCAIGHFKAINETPEDVSDYVSTTTIGYQDVYNMQTVSAASVTQVHLYYPHGTFGAQIPTCEVAISNDGSTWDTYADSWGDGSAQDHTFAETWTNLNTFQTRLAKTGGGINPCKVMQLYAVVTYTAGINISGSQTVGNGYTVKVAVNGAVQAQTGTTNPGGWTISGVNVPSGAVVTVWVDDVADSSESTGITKYDGTGDIANMALTSNTLTIGSDDNQSLNVADVGQYTCSNDEDVMHSLEGNVLTVNGTDAGCGANPANSYSDSGLTIKASNTLTIEINAGSPRTLTAHNVTITGTLTGAGAATINVGGTWNNNGTFNQGSSTVTLNGAEAQYIAGTTATSFNNLMISNTTAAITANTNFSVGGTLMVNASAVLSPAAGVVVSGGGTLTGSGTVRVSRASGDDFAIQYTITTKTLTTLTVDYLGGASQTISNTTYGNLTISGSPSTASQTAAVGLTAGNIFTIGSGVTFNPSAGTITMNNGSSIANSGTLLSFYTLSIANSATVSTASSFTVKNSLTVGTSAVFQPSAGTITFSGGSITNNSSSSGLTFYNLAITGATTTGSSFTIGHSINVSAGSFTASANTITMNNGSSITNSATLTFYNLTIANSATVTTVSGNFALNASGTFTIGASATFNPAAATQITAGGTIKGPAAAPNGTVQCTRTAATPDFNSQYAFTTKTLTYLTVEYAGAGNQTVNNLSYSNVVISGSGTKTLAALTTLTGNLMISAGTLASGNFNLNVAGDWTNSVGASGFTAGSATVELTGAGGSTQTVTGNTTFFNFKALAAAARTIKFTDGSNQTVSGTWTVTGAVGQLIILTRTGTSSNWTITPTAASVSYVNVSRSTNSGTSFCATFSTDGGNNNGWNISGTGSCTTAAPTNVTIGSILTNGFTVTWTDNSSDETKFKLWVSSAAADDCSDATYNGGSNPPYYYEPGPIPPGTASQAVSGFATPNTRYCVRMVANNAFGDSAYAYSPPKYLLANKPSVPNLYSSNDSSINLVVNANNNPAGTQYVIQYATDSVFTSPSSCGADWTGRTDQEVVNCSVPTNNTGYYFRLSARNGDNTVCSPQYSDYRYAAAWATKLIPNPTLQGYINSGLRLQMANSDARGDASETGTLTRGDTNATFMDDNGKLVTVTGSTDPRIEKVSATDVSQNPGRAVRIEESRTNSLLYSSFEAGTSPPTGWSVGNGLIATVTAGGIHSSNYASLVTTSGSPAEYMSQDVSLTSGTAYNYSIYARWVSGTNGNFVIFVDDGAGHSYLSPATTISSSSWQRVSFNFTAGATATYHVYVEPSRNAANVVTCMVDAAQLEYNPTTLTAATFATSYIPTTTGTVTRAAERLTYPTASNLTASAGTVSFWVKPDHNWNAIGSANETIFYFNNSGSDYANMVIYNNQIYIDTKANGTAVNRGVTVSSYTDNRWLFVSYSWSASGNALYVGNAGTLTSNTGAVATNYAAVGASFGVGSRNSGTTNVSNSLVSDFTIFNTALDADTIQGVYNGYGPSKVAISDPTVANQLTVAWQDNSGNEDATAGFTVENKQTATCTDASGWGGTTTKAQNTTSHDQGSLTAEVPYCFHVRGNVSTFSSPYQASSAAKYPGGAYTWNGGGSTNNWSEAANWISAPGAGNTAKFTDLGTSNSRKNASIDTSFAGTVGGLNIASGYSGTLTAAKDLTVSGDVTIAGGTLNAGNQTFNVGGSWSRTAGTFTASTGTVNFNAGSTGKTILSGGQHFNIVTFNNAAGGWTFSDVQNIDNNLTITAANSLTLGAFTHTVSGNVTLGGTTFTATGSTLVMNGTSKNLVGASKNLNNLTINGTITAATSNVNIYGTLLVNADKTFSINNPVRVIMQPGSTTTIANTGTVQNGTGTGRLDFVDTAGANLSITGTLSVNDAFYTSTASVIVPNRIYGGSVYFVNTTLGDYNVTLGTNANAITIAGFLEVQTTSSGTLTVLGTTNNPAMNITGNLYFTKTNTGVPSISMGSNTWTVTGNVNLTNGTITAGTGANATLVMNGVSTTLTPNAATFNNITFANTVGAFLCANDFAVNGVLNVDASNFSPSAGTITFNDGASITNINSGTLVFKGITIANGATVSTSANFSISGTLTLGNASSNFSPSGGTVTMAGTSWGITNNSGTLTFSGLTISETPTSQTSASFSVGGALTVNAGRTLAPTAGTITMTGGSIVNTDDDAVHLVFYNLTSSGAVSNSTNFNVANDFKITGSTFTSSGTPTYTVSGNIDFTAGAFTAGSSTLVMNGTSKTLTPNGQNLNNLTISGTISTPASATTLTVNGTLNVSGTFTPDASTVVQSGTGTLNGSGTAKVTKTGDNAFSTQYTIANKTLTNLTVQYAGASAQTVSAITYGNLEINMAGQTATLGGDVSASGNLTITAGELNGSSNNLSVGGNWSKSGTFTASTGKVTLNGSGAQSITGNTTFNNLDITTNAAREITFAGNSTTIVSDTLNITGSAGKVITLKSSDANNWTINPTKERPPLTDVSFVSYVNAQKSTNSGSPFCAKYSTDGSGNNGWYFSDTDSCVPSETSGVTISNISETGFKVDWTDNSSEDNFKVYVAERSAGDCSGATYGGAYATVGQNITTKDVSGRNKNIRYCAGVASNSSLFGEAGKNNSSPKYTLIEPITGVTWGDFTTNDLSAKFSDALSNLTAGNSGVKYTVKKADGSFIEESSWLKDDSYFDPTAGLDINTQYKFEIISRNGDMDDGGAAPASALKYTKIEAPTGIIAVAAGENQINLTVTNTLSNLDQGDSGVQFTESLGAPGGGGEAGFTTWVHTNSVSDTGLTANTKYRYEVNARNGDQYPSLYNGILVNKYTKIQTPANIVAPNPVSSIKPNSIELNVPGTYNNLGADQSGMCFAVTQGADKGGGGGTGFDSCAHEVTITDVGLTHDTNFSYTVFAQNGDGEPSDTTAEQGPFKTTIGSELIYRLPGQNAYNQGSNISGTPTHRKASEAFNVEMYAVDEHYYQDADENHLVNITTNAPSATITNPTLANGAVSYNATINSAGTWHLDGIGSAGSSEEFVVDPGKCDAGVSTVSAAPTSLDVEQTSTITIYLKDAAGNPLAGHAVSVSSNQGVGADTIVIYGASTDANGRITAGVTGHSAHTSTITVADTTDAVTLSTKPQITFNLPAVANPTNFAANAIVSACAGNPPSCTVQNALSWTNPAVFNQINIYRSETSGVRGAKIASTAGNSYTDSDVQAGVSYFYTLEAEDNAVPSNKSSGTAQVSARGVCNCGDNEAPTAPTNLRATKIRDTSISIAWDPSRDNVGVAGYQIFNPDTGIMTGVTSDTNYDFENLQPDTTYKFYVRAYDAAGNFSAFSEILTVKTLKGEKPAEIEVHLVLSNVPEEINAGQSFPGPVRVIAADAGGKILTDYQKAVYFESTDSQAKLPYTKNSPYAYTVADAGIHQFEGKDFALKTTGSQKLIVSDFKAKASADVNVVAGIFIENATEKIRDFIAKPETVNKANTAVVTTTALILLAPVLANALISFSTLLPQLLYWLIQILQALGIRKKAKPWGVVFNAETGQPISLAIVRIYEIKYNRLLERAVTDNQGRYGFLVKPGEFYITCSKAGFVFPAKEKKSTFYEKIYTGGNFKIAGKDQSIAFNIPLDPTAGSRQMINFWIVVIRINKLLQKIRIPLLAIGIVFALIMLIISFNILYILSLIFYALIGTLEILRGKNARPYGVVTDVYSHPIPLAIVRIFKKNNNLLVETDVSDSLGRFKFLVPPGIYYITATKPNYIDFKSHLMYLEKEKTLVSTTIKLKKEE